MCAGCHKKLGSRGDESWRNNKPRASGKDAKIVRVLLATIGVNLKGRTFPPPGIEISMDLFAGKGITEPFGRKSSGLDFPLKICRRIGTDGAVNVALCSRKFFVVGSYTGQAEERVLPTNLSLTNP